MTEEVNFGLHSAKVEAMRYDRSQTASTLDPIESDWLICRMVPKGSRTLDVGCGTGVLMSLLRDTCFVDVIGVEPNQDRAEAARARGFDVHTGIVTSELLNKIGFFDVIVFADVLEHVEDPGGLLNTVAAALRPGGRIVASIPNVAHWTVRSALLFGRFEYEPTGIMDATHLRWFTEKSVRNLFQDAGLAVQSFKHSAGFWHWRYHTGPAKLLPLRPRRAVVKHLTRAFPKLFGCQHVLYATKAAS